VGKNKVEWWKTAIIYQIYPLSFMDSNSDGIGDLQGIISKLSYLKNLGIDVIWLSPVYQSPMDDNGYDISDYLKIDPIFGTMKDMQELIKQTHDFGMKIIMDLVVNHTSDEHPWFKFAKESKNSPYRDFYIWNDQPNEIDSVFGGSAWTYEGQSEQYYFHLFSHKQPDLNWQNKKLREEIYRIINWWLDQGIDGFRLDVIDLIGKDVKSKMLSDGPFLIEYLNELNQNCFANRDVMTVGEMPGLSIERAAEITAGEHPLLNMVFQFTHISLDEMPNLGKWALKKLDLTELKQVFNKMQHLMYRNGWNSLFLANHDQPRAVSRFGDINYRLESSKMLYTMLYGMQGTPYVYQGEEIGMTGIDFEINQYRDLETLNIYEILSKKKLSHDEIMKSIHMKSRDNSRTPFQWDDQPYAGFSKSKPWIDVNLNYIEINAKKDIEDPNGVYLYFKKLFKLRKSFPVFENGNFNLIDRNHPSLFIYERKNEKEKLLIVSSFSNLVERIDLSNYRGMKCIISNQECIELSKDSQFPPFYTAIYYKGSDSSVND